VYIVYIVYVSSVYIRLNSNMKKLLFGLLLVVSMCNIQAESQWVEVWKNSVTSYYIDANVRRSGDIVLYLQRYINASKPNDPYISIFQVQINCRLNIQRWAPGSWYSEGGVVKQFPVDISSLELVWARIDMSSKDNAFERNLVCSGI